MTADAETLITEHYNKHSAHLRSYCEDKTSNFELARDIVHDAYLRTWKFLYTGKVIENLEAFVFRVVRNLIIDVYRSRWRMVNIDDMVELERRELAKYNDAFSSSSKKRDPRLTDLLALMETLRESDKQLMTMNFIEGRTPAEIAKILGVTPTAISVRIYRVAGKLRNLYLNNDTCTTHTASRNGELTAQEKFEIMINAVAKIYGITKEAVFGRSRQLKIALARDIIMYLCHLDMKMPVRTIAERFGLKPVHIRQSILGIRVLVEVENEAFIEIESIRKLYSNSVKHN